MKRITLPATEVWCKAWTAEVFDLTYTDVKVAANEQGIRLAFMTGGPDKGTDFEVRVGHTDFAALMAAMSRAMKPCRPRGEERSDGY